MDHRAIYEKLENIHTGSLSRTSSKRIRLHFGLAITKNKLIWSSKPSSALDCVFLKASSSRISISCNNFDRNHVSDSQAGRDSLIDLGTGNGKTLCIIIPCLLSPKSISIVKSPLKRLQVVQVLEQRTYAKIILVRLVSQNYKFNDP
jgi:hypothetical protein